MLKTIEFDGLSAMLLGFIDEQDGFLYLRMTGQETAIGAIWSRLSGRKDRGSKWGSPVKIPSYSNYDFSVASYKNVNYRTIRTSLPCGMIDLAMIHREVGAALRAEAGDVGCHFSHVYPTGAALYFTFVLRAADDHEAEARYLRMWDSGPGSRLPSA